MNPLLENKQVCTSKFTSLLARLWFFISIFKIRIRENFEWKGNFFCKQILFLSKDTIFQFRIHNLCTCIVDTNNNFLIYIMIHLCILFSKNYYIIIVVTISEVMIHDSLSKILFPVWKYFSISYCILIVPNHIVFFNQSKFLICLNVWTIRYRYRNNIDDQFSPRVSVLIFLV